MGRARLGPPPGTRPALVRPAVHSAWDQRGSTSPGPASRVTRWRSDLVMSRPCAAARECPGSTQMPEACSFSTHSSSARGRSLVPSGASATRDQDPTPGDVVESLLARQVLLGVTYSTTAPALQGDDQVVVGWGGCAGRGACQTTSATAVQRGREQPTAAAQVRRARTADGTEAAAQARTGRLPERALVRRCGTRPDSAGCIAAVRTTLGSGPGPALQRLPSSAATCIRHAGRRDWRPATSPARWPDRMPSGSRGGTTVARRPRGQLSDPSGAKVRAARVSGGDGSLRLFRAGSGHSVEAAVVASPRVRGAMPQSQWAMPPRRSSASPAGDRPACQARGQRSERTPIWDRNGTRGSRPTNISTPSTTGSAPSTRGYLGARRHRSTHAQGGSTARSQLPLNGGAVAHWPPGAGIARQLDPCRTSSSTCRRISDYYVPAGPRPYSAPRLSRRAPCRPRR